MIEDAMRAMLTAVVRPYGEFAIFNLRTFLGVVDGFQRGYAARGIRPSRR